MVQKSEVLQAIQLVLEEGGKPTQKTVRKELGFGSLRDIAPILSEWKRNRRDEAPAKVKHLAEGYLSLSRIDQDMFLETTELQRISESERRRREKVRRERKSSKGLKEIPKSPKARKRSPKKKH